MQFKIVLPNTNGIEGRYILKFRDNNEDPTFMRQILYSNIMNSLGYPTTQTVTARVYVNGRSVGYYVLQEEAASESFVRSAFHGDGNGKFLITKTKELGHAFDCSTGADFHVTGNSFSSFKPSNSRYDTTRIKALAKAFDKLDPTDDDAVEKFEKEWFDVDSFFKAIAMQYLTGHFDSYWFDSTNYAMYNDPTQSTSDTFKFYFICQDWDYTFGLNLSMPYVRYKDFVVRSYKDFVGIPWKVRPNDAPDRVAINKLLANPKLQKRFETILKKIVTEVFNPVVLEKRLNALVERHRDEMEWNFSASNLYPLRSGTGTQYNWSMSDFENNITKRVGHGASYGILQFVYLRVRALKEEFDLDVDLGDGSNYKIVYDIPTVSTDGTCGDKGRCPYGECCSAATGLCGTTTSFCGLSCISEFGKCNYAGVELSESDLEKIKVDDPSLPISTDDRCGEGHGICPFNKCCSKYGYCGTTDKHCGAGCQTGFGKCNVSNITTTTTTTTKPITVTSTKVETTKTEKTTIPISTNSRCGEEFGMCPDNKCCSKYGYCGTTDKHCGTGCQAGFGKCNITEIKATTTIVSTVKATETKATSTTTTVLPTTSKVETKKTEIVTTTTSVLKTETKKPVVTTTATTTITTTLPLSTKKATSNPEATSIPISTNASCGEDFGRCPGNKCCSKYGYCGVTDGHCGIGCQAGFGKCNTNTTTEIKATTTSVITVKATQTKATIDTTTKPVTTKTIKTSAKSTATVTTSTSGKCGVDYGNCPKGQCCSKYGYCGTTTSYCGNGCQSAFGVCN